jgi:RNA polymerase sigma-70 factor (ECF subfamily)
MSEADRDILLRRLALDYGDIKKRLTRNLGSSDQAADALHDTWVRLGEAKHIGPVERPAPYLLRIAHRLAFKQRSAQRETVTLDDACAALHLIDDAPEPDQIAEARSELKVLDDALAELSPRRRDILWASRVEGERLSSIADRLGLSQRMIEKELKLALLHCGERLGKTIVQRFGPGVAKGSSKRSGSREG